MPTFYVSDEIHPHALDELADMGVVHLGYGPQAVRYEQVSNEIDGVLLRGEIFDAAKIGRSPRLKIIARHGVGTDNVDIDAATAASVWVTTTPASNSNAVAEHVFALLLTLARQLPAATRATGSGQWAQAKAALQGGFELRGRTLGLVGFGSIARRVLDIAHGFGMTVLACDPYTDDTAIQKLGATPVTLDQLVTGADVISLHLPLSDSTRHLFDRTRLAAMRPGAVLINTSRGGLVDESALLTALTEGDLAGAALDVLEGESIDMRDPLPHSRLAGELARLDNLILTPHTAGQTNESMLAAGTMAVQCVRQVLTDEVPDNAVNLINPSDQLVS